MRGSHQFKFRVPYANNDSFKFSYFPRTIADWNCLPEAIGSASSLESFKSNLSAFLNYFILFYGWCDVLAIFTDVVYVDVDRSKNEPKLKFILKMNSSK